MGLAGTQVCRALALPRGSRGRSSVDRNMGRGDRRGRSPHSQCEFLRPEWQLVDLGCLVIMPTCAHFSVRPKRQRIFPIPHADGLKCSGRGATS